MDSATAAKHLEALKKNPPRKTDPRKDLGGVFYIEVFSVMVGKYIPQFETRRPDLAAEALKDERKEHRRVLAELAKVACESELFYAREMSEVGGQTVNQYVRFASAANRKHWLNRDPVNRAKAAWNCSTLLEMQARGVTWEYIDGVSYAREPQS